MSRYRRWARVEHPESTRIVVTLLTGPVFLLLLPIVVGGLGPRLDHRLGLRPLFTRASGRTVGALLTASGFSLGLWTVYAQLDRGRGTPLPVMPTQELLTDGPYRYCRNPMTLGAILAYLGVALTRRTAAGTAIVLGFATALLTYLRRFEERELGERFGEAYAAYRRATPARGAMN
jgi:protein-S-isoprenylcysteine O-methyltransferase Ste14